MSLLDDIIEDRDCEGFDAYMRRSCRVVELEQAYIDLRRAGDELANVMDLPNQSCVRTSRYLYRWDAVDAALTAYRTAIGDV